MGIKFWNTFVKLTAWPVQKLCFRTKIYYEDRSVQSRRIKGPAIIISNHTSVFDYVIYLFAFFGRTLRFQMAELLFEKKLLGWLLRRLGGIFVDRNAFDFGFVAKSEEILRQGGVVGIFPESRLPLPGEKRPLPFRPSAAFLALSSGVPVIPVYTDGSYFRKKRAHIIIGKPIYLATSVRDGQTEKETIAAATQQLYERMIELEQVFHERCKTEKEQGAVTALPIL